MKANVINYLLFLAVALVCETTFSQINNPPTIAGNNNGYPILNTHQEMVSGKMHPNQLTIRIQKYTGGTINQWKITVRLLDDFININNSNYRVDAEHAQIAFNQMNNHGSVNLPEPSNVPVVLSKFEDIDLIIGNTPLQSGLHTVFQYNFFITGGHHLLVSPNASYRTNYELKIWGRQNANQNYQLMNTAVVNSAGFQIDYSGNHGQQNIVLQNGANQFNFDFQNVSDYMSGKSIEIGNGLKVQTYNQYDLTVKSSNSEFVSSTTSHTIPISVLHVEATSNNPPSQTDFYGPVSMSTLDQTLIKRTATNPQTLEYNLRLFIPPNTIPRPIVEGLYTAYIYFTIVPL